MSSSASSVGGSGSSGEITTKLQSFEEISKIAKETFRRAFGREPAVACCAPGRVNLIGEHIDYNDGFVLPMALPMVTLIVGEQCPGNEAHVITCCSGVDEPRQLKFINNNLKPGKPHWANYIKGVLHFYLDELRQQGQLPASQAGFNAVIASNVPLGAGLSSSAALEMATLCFLEQVFGQPLESDARRALICQQAEHRFAGMPCGIMDQMIAVLGKENHALKLDCRSLETFQIPFVAKDKDLVVLICNSGVRHELSQSEYPLRRQQCSEALQQMSLKSYRDATLENLMALTQTGDVSDGKDNDGRCCDEVRNPKDNSNLLLQRARHVITEIKRTQEAADALKAHNFEKMGRLMTQSHASLRDDFQVSCPELDVLVDAAINCSGVLGSRMTGGGFGGCSVTLLQQDAVERAISNMRATFAGKFNKAAAERLEFYICSPSAGAKQVSM